MLYKLALKVIISEYSWTCCSACRKTGLELTLLLNREKMEPIDGGTFTRGTSDHQAMCLPSPVKQMRLPCLHFPPPPPYPPPEQDHEPSSECKLTPLQSAHDVQSLFNPSLMECRTTQTLLKETDCSSPSQIANNHIHWGHDAQSDDLALPSQSGFKICSSEPSNPDERTCFLHRTETTGLVNDLERNEYSYAYYEPGISAQYASSVASIPSASLRHSKHTFTTHYGTEENIYEEISEVSGACAHRAREPPPAGACDAGLQEEVRRVHWRHRRVLGELNLAVEAMLMPGTRDEGEPPAASPGPRAPRDDLLVPVSPTDELLSPTAPATRADPSAAADPDSVFSVSSAASAPGPPRRRSAPSPRCPHSAGGFWSRCAWKRIPGLGVGGFSSRHESRPQTNSWDEGDSGNNIITTGSRGNEGVESGYTVETEESWGSVSDHEFSGEEGAVPVIKKNGQLRFTLIKARTLRDKWRGGKPTDTISGVPPGEVAGSVVGPRGKLSRWFSIRRGSAHQYHVDLTVERNSNSNKMPLLPEVEEETASNFSNFSCMFRRQLPPSLPVPPADLTSQQIKRRHIVAAIVHSENSYVATLQRLVNDYKKPLEESSPPILSASKISTLFLRLPEILQCHTLFRIALAECVRNWDRDEEIGEIFVASFSKAIVLEIYSDFINNFSVAMDLAKMEAKRKSALSDFLKVKQISAHDRLSFFGLMVKPVQRFPQFILFLQDLLKHTPHGHHDRMSLQLALTQLESLAEMLNERKREAEQLQACREMLRHISGKFSAKPRSDCQRYLLREDNVTQLEFNQSGLIIKSKSRRLLLLNDLVVCVSVTPKTSDDFICNDRLSLKWTNPVSDIEIVDTSTSPTLSRLLAANSSRGGSLKSERSISSLDSSTNGTASVDNICVEMNNLMHDYEVVSRIAVLVSSLKGTYKELTIENTRHILNTIQSSIQQKDEEMAWVDSCCLQLAVHGRSNKEVYTFQTTSPSVKKEWITELRLAQLALDPNNSPAWEVPEQERRPSTKMPLFVKAQAVYKSQHQTEVRCGCYYTVNNTRVSQRRSRTSNYLWVCTTDGASSHIAILMQSMQQQAHLRDVAAFDLVETKVSAMEFVHGALSPGYGLCSDTVWMGTDSRRLLIYAAAHPEHQQELGSCVVSSSIVHIRSHCNTVFVALADGSLLLYHRQPRDGEWALGKPSSATLGSEPVSSLLPINNCLYAACGRKVWVLDAISGEVQKNFSVQEHLGSVNLMAHSGIGLWISLKNSSTICLYHTETFKHLQDINIASNVLRANSGSTSSSSRSSGSSGGGGGGGNSSSSNSSSNSSSSSSSNSSSNSSSSSSSSSSCSSSNSSSSSSGSGSSSNCGGGGSSHSNCSSIKGEMNDCTNKDCVNSSSDVTVTSLMACKGLLWVGTDVGISLTIPLPRLEGVPIISGRVNISYHAHFGPIHFLLALHPRSTNSSFQTWKELEEIETKDSTNADSSISSDTCKLKEEEKQQDTSIHKSITAKLKQQLTNSPVVLRRRTSKETDLNTRRASKTLPRGLGSGIGFLSMSTTSSQGSSDTCDVYGLYGELMYVKDYDGEENALNGVDPIYESLHRSDPELAAIPGKVSTLDRHLKLKVSRPRSLDLSNWSVDSKSSMYTSSGSEETLSLRNGGRSVSRHGSSVSGSVDVNNASECIHMHAETQELTKKKTMEKNPGVTSVTDTSRRTIITLMGGRGYVNWRHACCPDENKSSKSSGSFGVDTPNCNDAHIVIWEMKL